MTTPFAPVGIQQCKPDMRRVTVLALVFACILSILFNIALFNIAVMANVGVGGLISEKLIERAGVSSSRLTLEMSGVSGGSLVLGMAGDVVTGAVTDINSSTGEATLHGTLSSLKGLPQVLVYFEWGYTSACGTSITTGTAMTGTGNYSIPLTGFDTTREVFYRAVVDGDGTSRGAVFSFTSGKVAGSTMLRIIIPIIIAAGIIIGILKQTEPILLIKFIIAGLVAYIIAQAVINSI